MKRDPEEKKRLRQKPRVIGRFDETADLPELDLVETPAAAKRRKPPRAKKKPAQPEPPQRPPVNEAGGSGPLPGSGEGPDDVETPPGAIAFPTASRLARIEKARARRRKRRIRLAVLCTVALAALLAYFTGLYGASLSVLGDTVDSVRIALTPGRGFPAAFSMPDLVTAQPFAGGFAALGRQELQIVASNGNEVYSVQHSYASPALAVGNTRVCLYNRTGAQLAVYNRSRKLFETEYADGIFACAMSPNGSLAVFHGQSLVVYDPLFETVFEWQTSEVPTALAFASDNRQFAVGAPRSSAGALGGRVYLYTTDANAPDAATAVIESADGVPVGIEYLSRKTVLVVYNTSCALYDTATGAELARYAYGGDSLQSWAVSDGANNVVLLFGDGTHSSATRLCVLDTALSPVGTAEVGRIARGLAVTRTGAYVCTANSILSYQLDGAFLGESVQDARILALVPAKKLFVLTDGAMDVFEPPAPAKTG